MRTEILAIAVPLAATLLSHAVLWGRLSEKLDRHEQQLREVERWKSELIDRSSQIERETAVIKTELIGATGMNGLRSEVRGLSQKLDSLITGQ